MFLSERNSDLKLQARKFVVCFLLSRTGPESQRLAEH